MLEVIIQAFLRRVGRGSYWTDQTRYTIVVVSPAAEGMGSVVVASAFMGSSECIFYDNGSCDTILNKEEPVEIFLTTSKVHFSSLLTLVNLY